VTTKSAPRDSAASAGRKEAAAVKLPDNRDALLALHREARQRRDAAPLLSEARAEAAFEIERIEVEIARIERAMDPPLV
jgi:hypothetical protein